MPQKVEAVTLEVERIRSGRCALSPAGTKTDGSRTDFLFEGEGARACVSVDTLENRIVCRASVSLRTETIQAGDGFAAGEPVKLGVRLAQQPECMTALYLFKDWWTKPAFLRGFEEMPEHTQCVLLKNSDGADCLLPMAGGDWKTEACPGRPGELSLAMARGPAGAVSLEETVFVLARAEDIFSAVHAAFSWAAREKGIPLRSGRRYPEMFRYLGWCSWNACYTDVSEEKIRSKVREFSGKNIPVRWVLIDDGWLSVKDGRLTSFSPDPQKFPQGFGPMIKQLTAESQVRWFGVWHAFGGYWGGVMPGSEAAEREAGHLYRTADGKLLPYPEAEHGYGFWRDWYDFLRAQGISFVKADGQSAVKSYYESDLPFCRAARGAHEALDGAAAAYMDGNLINCMGMASENFFSRPGSAVSRNSDDFFPDAEDGFSSHLMQNAYNAVWQDELYVCDWDMFWSGHKDARRHAVLRAVSGGPVYGSDRIGETVKSELEPLAFRDGSLPRLDRAAKPSEDCIFSDPRQGRPSQADQYSGLRKRREGRSDRRVQSLRKNSRQHAAGAGYSRSSGRKLLSVQCPRRNREAVPRRFGGACRAPGKRLCALSAGSGAERLRVRGPAGKIYQLRRRGRDRFWGKSGRAPSPRRRRIRIFHPQDRCLRQRGRKRTASQPEC
jgi:raffinose synthase